MSKVNGKNIGWRQQPPARAIVLVNCVLLNMGISTPLYAARPGPNVLPIPRDVLVNPNQGAATISTVGNSMTVNQTTNKAILNWKSFNIGADGKVQFVQPSVQAIALNRIYDSDASYILGQLGANGTIYLINTNGIIFGIGSQVNVHGLIASTLNIQDSDFLNSSISQAINDGKAAFEGGSQPDASVLVESGAKIQTDSGGQVLMFAPSITNAGEISTPDGQTILAASKDKVYLALSDNNPNLRGLLVEVDSGGDVTNVGKVVAERGNITLLGLAVNQNGRLTATTSVDVNGSIRLIARDKAEVTSDPTKIQNSTLVDDLKDANDKSRLPTQTNLAVATESGTVTVGNGSITEVVADSNSKTAADAQTQNHSRVDLIGKSIEVQSRASIAAKGGKVNLVATTTPDNLYDHTQQTESRIYLGVNSTIDVSGENILLPMSRRVIKVELFADELKDSPLQRNGFLHGKKVMVDIDKGSPLIADLSKELAKIQRDVKERNTAAGAINLSSQGDVLFGANATLNLTGGSTTYASGYVNTTKLLTSDGRIVDIGSADPSRQYIGIFGEHTVTHPKWGKTVVGQNSLFSKGTYRQGFTEGNDGGALDINAQTAYGLDLATIQAGATAGINQRALAYAPKGGAISIKLGQGADASVLTNIQDAIIAKTQQSAALNFDDSYFVNGLPGNFNISAQQLNQSGAGKFTLLTNGKVVLNADASLSLKSGAAIDLTGTGVDIEGSIRAPSGSITLKAAQSDAQKSGGIFSNYDLKIGSGAQLDSNGIWINDLLDAKSPMTPLAINGGAISLSSNGILSIAPGAQLHSDAGAQLTTAGKISGGRGGSVVISDATLAGGVSSRLQIAGNLSAYGFTNGGSLSITAPGISIGTNPQNGDDQTFWLAPDYFNGNSFSSYSLIASDKNVEVSASAQVYLRQNNRELTSLQNASRAATGSDVNAFSHTTLLPDYLRNPVSLSLTASNTPGNVILDAGSLIALEPQAALNLSAVQSIAINGSILAHSSNVNAVLTAHDAAPQYLSRVIWLGDSAVIDASATHTAQWDVLGRDIGKTYDAGNVTFTANRGFIAAAPGSRIDVSGNSFYTNIAGAHGRLSNVLVNAGAGAISFTASDGIAVYGDLEGHAAGSNGIGGQLSYEIDANNGNYTSTPQSLSQVHRVLIGAELPAWDNSIQFGQPLPSSFLNNALVGANSITSSGFSQLMLGARNTFSTGGARLSYSNIDFVSNLSLSIPDLLVLSASNINANDHTVNLSAGILELGQHVNTSEVDQNTNTAVAGTGILNLYAKFVELFGNINISGARETNIHSDGDVRLRSPIDPNSLRSLAASTLTTAGDLNISSSQMYVSTLSDYTFNLTGDNSTFSTANNGVARTPILSAAGKLTVNAPNVDLGGVLAAPLGTVNIVATNDVHLRAGSVIDVSANNLSVPFGRTLGETLSWIYAINPDAPLVIQNTPQKSVNITAPSVNMEGGSQVNLSGGGDIYAIEQIPGPGGSKDFLDPAFSNGAFAVVPWLNSQVSPFDQVEMNRFTVNGMTPKIGDIIYLDGGAGLPAGNYAILPAHYALMQGAYLITPKAANWAQGETATQIDGTTWISGRYGRAFTNSYDGQWLGFAVEPGSVARTRSEFKQITGDEFFNGVKTADAGSMTIAATTNLDLNGSILSTASENARKAQLDIIANQIEIVDKKSANTGVVQLEVAGLNHLGVDSLLIGGLRSGDSDKTTIDVRANSVTVENGAALSVPDVILVATNQVNIEAGASVAGTGGSTAAVKQFNIVGDGALLRASSASQSDIVRTGVSGASGVLAIAGRVSADKSLLLDATQDFSLGGILAFTPPANTTTSLNLTANRISLGDGSGAATDGIKFTNAQLAALNPSELRLSSRSSIDVYGNVSISNQSVQLNTGALRNMSGGDVKIVAADTLQLDNNIGASETAGIVGGTLALSAGKIELGSDRDGTGKQAVMQLRGFDSVTLGEAGKTTALHGNGNFALHTDDISGHSTVLTVNADRINAGANTNTELLVNGDLLLKGSKPTAADSSAALGGKFALTGKSVVIDGARVELPSGDITIKSTASDDSIALQNGAVLDVAGRDVKFPQGSAIHTSGGNVSIQSGGNVKADNTSSVQLGNSDQGADAGALNIVAQGQTLWNALIKSNVAEGFNGGSLKLSVNSFGDFKQWLQTIASSGLTKAIDLRARTGDIATDNGDPTISSRSITIAADTGNINWNSGLDASGKSGGNIGLYAGNNLTLGSSARLNASATASGGNGGSVELSAQNKNDTPLAADSATLTLMSGSQIDVHGNTLNIGDASSGIVSTIGKNGNVTLRAPRIATMPAGTDDDVNFTDNGVSITGADRIQLVATKTYSEDTSSQPITSLSQVMSDALNDAQSFMNNQSAITTRIGGIASAPNFHLMPGIDICSDSDLTVDSAVDLSNSHFNGEPGVLTLRAAGNINVNSDIKDGEIANTTSLASVNLFKTKLFLMQDYSWSYNIVAGDDQGAAQSTRSGQSGDLTINNGADIITGTGNIGLYGGGKIEATNSDTVIASIGRSDYTTYTSYKTGASESIPDTGSIDPYYFGATILRLQTYPQGGGSVDINAGTDVKFAASTSFFSDWIERLANKELTIGGTLTGGNSSKKTIDLTTWGILLDFINQGVLALGGGNISVSAGENIINLNAATPTTAKQIGVNLIDPTKSSNRIQLMGGGNIDVQAGKDVLSPRLFGDRGAIDIRAGGRIGALNQGTVSSTLTPEDLAAILVIADTQANLQARGEIAIESIVNSAVLPISKYQRAIGTITPFRNYFFTYSPDAKISLASIGGDIRLVNSTTSATNVYGINWSFDSQVEPNFSYIFTIDPGQFFANAAQGNILINGDLALFPSAYGQLSMLAGDSIITTDNANHHPYQINLSDVDLNTLPSWNQPAKAIGTDEEGAPLKALVLSGNAASLRASTPIHANDDTSAVIAALKGDITAVNGLTFAVSKPTEVYAGGDISNINFDIQHARDNQVSEIIATGNIAFPFGIDKQGRLEGVDANGKLITDDNKFIRIEGPGSLDVIAGKDISLGGALGIESIGNQKNPALPDHGATLNLRAGINGVTALTDPVLYNKYADLFFSPANLGFASGNYIQWFENYSATDFSSLISAFTGQHYAARADAIFAFANLPVLTQQAISLHAYELSAGTKPDYSANLISFVSLENFGGDLTQAVSSITRASYANNRAAAIALAQLSAEQQLTAARNALNAATPQQRRNLLLNVLTSEIHSAGVQGQAGTGSGYARGYTALSNMFPGDKWKGDINLVFSTIRTVGGGDINLVVPGGNVNVGLANQIAGLSRGSADLGIIAQAYGKINGIASGSFNVNQSRIFSLGGGEITLWSSYGDIDAGKGAKTALTIPPPRVTQDPQTGAIKLIFPAAVSGSGIQAANSISSADPTADGAFAVDDSITYGFGEDTRLSRLRFYDSLAKGNANLFAPQGTINAGDAGISVAGNLIIGAQHVVGADNINVGGIAIGVPTATSISAGTLSLGNVASSATNSATGSMNDAIKNTAAALSEGSVAFVTVDVIGTSR